MPLPAAVRFSNLVDDDGEFDLPPLEPANAVATAAASHDCRYYAILATPLDVRELKDGLLAHNLTDELIEAMDRDNWLEASLPDAGLLKSYLPAIWKTDMAKLGSSPQVRLLKHALLTDHELTYGLACPVHGPYGRHGAVIYSGRTRPFQPGDIADLHRASLESFEAIRTSQAVPASGATNLTNRECDCLYWTAAGKTSGEIGIILSISQHTVNHYLTGAIQKLNAINRTQAVVKALHFQLIAYPQMSQPNQVWG